MSEMPLFETGSRSNGNPEYRGPEPQALARRACLMLFGDADAVYRELERRDFYFLTEHFGAQRGTGGQRVSKKLAQAFHEAKPDYREKIGQMLDEAYRRAQTESEKNRPDPELVKSHYATISLEQWPATASPEDKARVAGRLSRGLRGKRVPGVDDRES